MTTTVIDLVENISIGNTPDDIGVNIYNKAFYYNGTQLSDVHIKGHG